MKFRVFLCFGFCSSLLLTSSAFAAPPALQDMAIPTAGQASSDVVPVAAKAEKSTKKTASRKSTKKSKTAKKTLTPEEQKAADKLAAKQAKEAARLAKAEARKKAAEESKAAYARAAAERKAAYAKAAEERKEKAAQAAEQRRIATAAKAKAAADQRLAKAKVEQDRRDARLRAAQERRDAIARADQARRDAELAQLASLEINKTGNNGELRSETVVVEQPKGLFANLFGGSQIRSQAMLPETRALDAALERKQAKKQFQVRPEFMPQEVSFTGYPRGTIVIDTSSRFLYLTESSSRARRYAIAVGRDGLQFKGSVQVKDKQEWPRWIPTLDMQKRDPKKYGQYKDGMPGGPTNPLGARAIYLYQGGKDTHLRIHGTTEPQSIGTSASNGCFRMINEHVMDLYRRVPVGTPVVVL